jgi:formate/nitrite transporter FocA (FNT family)
VSTDSIDDVGQADQIDDKVRDAADETVTEGTTRLSRSSSMLIATGLLGGIEISFGALAYLVTLHETGSHLLAGLAFSIGFISLYLAHSELFTEGFLYPVVALLAGKGTVGALLRLWSVTLVMNLIGGWLMMWLVVKGFPELESTITESARYFVDAPLSWRTVSLALLAGGAITLMTRMQAGAVGDVSTIVAAVAGAYMLAGLLLFHSIIDSIIIFGAIHSDSSGIGYGDWLGWFWYVTPLNVVGGLLLVTLPRVIRTKAMDASA